MKNSIKSLTLSIEEIRQIIADASAGNADAASAFVDNKIREKRARLKIQREKRKQRKEEKAKNSPSSEPSNTSGSTNSNTGKSYATLELNRHMADAILHFYRQRDNIIIHLETLARRLPEQIGSLSIKNLREGIKTFLRMIERVYRPTYSYVCGAPTATTSVVFR